MASPAMVGPVESAILGVVIAAAGVAFLWAVLVGVLRRRSRRTAAAGESLGSRDG